MFISNFNILSVLSQLSLQITMPYRETLFFCIPKYFNSKFKFSRKFLNKSVAVRRFPRCIVSIWVILLYKNFIKIKQESLNLLSKYGVIYLPIHNRGKTLPINILAWLLKLSQYSNMFYTETYLLYIFILTN